MNEMTPLPPAASTDERQAPRSGVARRAGWIAVPVIALGAAWFLTHRGPAAPPPMPVPTVTVATPIARDVAEWDDYVGRFEPSRAVDVRPRVSGQVTAIHFTDGQLVHAGQPLFTIDPRPFTAALAEAKAGVASARSDLALAQANLARANRLVADDAVSKSDLDQLRARVQATVAALAAAQARVRSRALDVEFTQVRAPISGRVSNRKVDAGNLVAAGEGASSTLLTTINALDPIYFSFDASEALFLKAKRAREAGEAPSAVEVKLQDENDYRWHGRLDFTDNGIDPRSGTIRSRATISNPNLFLTPGMFGNMRLSSGGTVHALLVPDAAVTTDQVRKTVLTVGPDGTVVAKPIVPGPVIDGLRVVRSGLAPGDKVVISGIQMAVPGGKVQVRAGRIAPVAPESGPTITAPTTGEGTFAR